jgi:protein-ribulosamine 3-kinase
MNLPLLFDHISAEILHTDTIVSSQPQFGGCLNNVLKIQTRSGQSLLLKCNTFDKSEAFRLEVEGLDLLRGTLDFSTPMVKGYGRFEKVDYLVMDFIEQGPPVKDYWRYFGEHLAKLHRHTQPEYGWREDNYIGPLVQYNQSTRSWLEFFIQYRLEALLKLAVDEKKMNETHARQFNKLFTKLDQYIPEETPALLHGDLWSGNILTATNGLPVLIDPAIYYGNREIELAYTQLFDRFDKEFYHAYNSEYPLLPGFDERVRLHQLYPLMVHVNLFGGGYVGQVVDILKFYV